MTIPKKNGAGQETTIITAAREGIKNLKNTFFNHDTVYKEMVQYQIIEPGEGSREEFEETVAGYRNDLSKELKGYTRMVYEPNVRLSKPAQVELQDIELERAILMHCKNEE